MGVPNFEAVVNTVLRLAGDEAGLSKEASAACAALRARVGSRVFPEAEVFAEVDGADAPRKYQNLLPAIAFSVEGEGGDVELEQWTMDVSLYCLGGTEDGAAGSPMPLHKPGWVYRAASEVFRHCVNVATDYGVFVEAEEVYAGANRRDDGGTGWPFKLSTWRVVFYPPAGGVPAGDEAEEE